MSGSLLAALVVLPIPAALTLPAPAVLRVTHAMPILAVVDAIGVVAVWDLARLVARRKWRLGNVVWLAPIAALLVAGASSAVELEHRYHDYFVEYKVSGRPTFEYGVEQSVRYALDHATEYDQIYITGVPEPYAYVLFFGQWDPADIHARLQVVRDPPWFNGVLSFDRYIFQDAPADVVSQLPVVETVTASDGSVMFELRGGATSDGKRILVVRRPPP